MSKRIIENYFYDYSLHFSWFFRVVNRVGLFLMKKKLNFNAWKLNYEIFWDNLFNNYSLKNDRKHICIVRKFFLYSYQFFLKTKVSIKFDFIKKFFKFNWENIIIFLYLSWHWYRLGCKHFTKWLVLEIDHYIYKIHKLKRN